MDQPTTLQNSLAGNIVSHSSGNSVSTLTKSKASMPASSAVQSWPGNYQSCKCGYQSTLSSRRNKGKSYFQPHKIKETWTHDFCVVDKRDQRKVPSTTHKQELCEAGLGQKTVIFKNKRGEFRHIQEELFNRYAKLQTHHVYLVTYSQTDMGKMANCQAFADCILEAFSQSQGNQKDNMIYPEYWSCCMEDHKDGGKHYHMTIKLSAPKRWKGAKDFGEPISCKFG